MTHRTTIAVSISTITLVVAYAVFGATTAGLTSNFTDALAAPSLTHLAGTDHSGFDLAARTAHALRLSLTLAAVSALASVALGVTIGATAATLGGKTEAALMKTTDFTNALPHLVAGVLIVAMFGGTPAAIVVSIAVTHWPQTARIIRATCRTTLASGWVAAAYNAGASRWWILTRHILPATATQASVALAMMFPHAIWHESTLSFLGLGLQPHQPSIGTLLAQARTDIMVGAWWTLAIPTIPLVAVTVAVAVLASRWAKGHTA